MKDENYINESPNEEKKRNERVVSSENRERVLSISTCIQWDRFCNFTL